MKLQLLHGVALHSYGLSSAARPDDREWMCTQTSIPYLCPRAASALGSEPMTSPRPPVLDQGAT
jgi:hypothetical protein